MVLPARPSGLPARPSGLPARPLQHDLPRVEPSTSRAPKRRHDEQEPFECGGGASRQPAWVQKSKQTAAGCFFIAPSNNQCVGENQRCFAEKTRRMRKKIKLKTAKIAQRVGYDVVESADALNSSLLAFLTIFPNLDTDKEPPASLLDASKELRDLVCSWDLPEGEPRRQLAGPCTPPLPPTRPVGQRKKPSEKETWDYFYEADMVDLTRRTDPKQSTDPTQTTCPAQDVNATRLDENMAQLVVDSASVTDVDSLNADAQWTPSPEAERSHTPPNFKRVPGGIHYAGEAEAGEPPPPVMMPRLGISFTLDQRNSSQRRNEPAYIHLSTVSTQLTINVEKCLLGGVEGDHCKTLRWLFATEQISLHAEHAAAVASRLYKLGFESNVRDMATSVRRREKRELVQVCKMDLKRKDLMAMTNPIFERNPSSALVRLGRFVVGQREAFFCSLLAQAYPHTLCVTTRGRDKQVVAEVESKVRTLEIGLHHELEARENKRVIDCDSLQLHESSYNEETGDFCPAHLSICLKRVQQMPLPSKSEVLEFKLAYLYWPDDDNERTGSPLEGVFSEMYGQVFRTSGQRADVYFPLGIRVEHGYVEVPRQVVATKSGKYGEPGREIQVHRPFDPRQDRLVVKEIIVHGQAEPSDHELLTYEDANLQLRLGLKNTSDRSTFARTLSMGSHRSRRTAPNGGSDKQFSSGPKGVKFSRI